ncbi:MAG TPA: biopolymer transporter ExbD [Steroidobacteraceae bacterium]|nr:biopolymer transporter ExbD [Steroidobacteraceae bacterium]
MSMTVGSPDEEERDFNSTINTTPLVDVMLVLLIIFLITIPVINKTVPVHLPNAVNIPTQTKPENVVIAVNADGKIFWNNGSVADINALIENIKAVAVRKPQPEIHIRADKDARYESVGRVLYAIQRGGVVKVGFLSEPDRNSLALGVTQQH